MPTVTYDTSVFISRKPAYLPAGFIMSAVVMQELAVGAVDDAELKRLNGARLAYEKENRFPGAQRRRLVAGWQSSQLTAARLEEEERRIDSETIGQ